MAGMIVIADDITGAAEIAGIAHSLGQPVRLSCSCDNWRCHEATSGTTVIATDTRSMTESQAVAETLRIADTIMPLTAAVFKKTDSALRGHVVAELEALMQATGYRRAVYLPANPSKGRIIRNGTYYIIKERGEGRELVPIHETDFSFDPEFPATTSKLQKRFPDAASKSIIMPDAESTDDLFSMVRQYDDGKTLFAGAADLFSEYMKTSGAVVRAGRTGSPSRADWESGPGGLDESTLVLCGSTQSKPLNLGIAIAPMPQEIYDGSCNLSSWNTEAYRQQHSLILTIPHTHRTGKEVAVHLRTMMARMAKQLIDYRCPAHLVIEGGATAWATLQALGWTAFDIVRQIAPGVVQMRAHNGTLVTLKPGSYPWGGLF